MITMVQTFLVIPLKDVDSHSGTVSATGCNYINMYFLNIYTFLIILKQNQIVIWY